ncbi:hypothetical protein VL20_6380 [Microcystis panniformis FACHB-1757]|uniref:Uncharacterized protein n=1 Tax=Microcystis panniformis FACHB-1757 TaxID=1638788 RepID=A0A0K1SAI2_9CHRO|nr:hypothetical protein VL20_6380 [Microcystis panniformis FACHB-1757]
MDDRGVTIASAGNDCSDFLHLDKLYFFRSLSYQLLRTYAAIPTISNYRKSSY